MNYEYGSNTPAILFMRNQQMSVLDRQRADTILARSELDTREAKTEAHYRALRAARVWTIEQEVISASEMLRRAMWQIMWDSTWADAWNLQWVIARAGVGVATQGLVGLADYTIEDYITLVSPWTVGFTDLPIPYPEGLVA